MSRGFSPHRNFADNLRALCARHGSIAAVCSAIGMNRQQFNKYLAGSTLPNAPTLEKICGFFEIAPESLFQAPPAPGGSALPAAITSALSSALDRLSSGTLRPGCYHFYTPWPREPGKCLRAALFIYQKGGLTLFTRFTKFRNPGSRQRYELSARHDGVVLESDKAKYLLATSRKGVGNKSSGEMSLVSIGVEGALSRDFQSGLALEMDPSGSPAALRATLEYRGSSALLRQTISEACILPLSDPAIPEEVRQSVSAPPHAPDPCLAPFSLLDSLPQPSRRGGVN
jgi:transcriptional regulator with XRE-family HTH domain